MVMSERKELFRVEAVLHKSDRSHSAPVIHQKGMFRTLIWLSAALLLLALILVTRMNYKETEAAQGILEPSRGVQKIVSPAAAMVIEISVEEGQIVTSGQVLATLSTSLFDHSGRRSQAAQIQQLQSERDLLEQEQVIHEQLHEQSAARIRAAILNLKISVGIVTKESEILISQTTVSNYNLDSLRRLLQNSNVSQSQYDQRYLTHLNLLRQQQEVSQRQQKFKDQLDDYSAQRIYVDLEFAKSRLHLQKESTQLEFKIDQLSNQGLITAVAVEDGIVAAIAIEEGQPVVPNQPLLYINPTNDELEAVIYVPSRVLGKIAPGQRLLLSYDAFNYQNYGRYSATVKLISRASLDPREHLLPVPDIGEPVFKVIASLDQEFVEGPEIYRLQPGLLLTADFVIDEMSLTRFVLKPLLKLRGRAW